MRLCLVFQKVYTNQFSCRTACSGGDACACDADCSTRPLTVSTSRISTCSTRDAATQRSVHAAHAERTSTSERTVLSVSP